MNRYIKALTPSAETKAEYIGEFKFDQLHEYDDGYQVMEPVYVPWTTIKEIMKAIKSYAERDLPETNAI
jgi:hypothetical protein